MGNIVKAFEIAYTAHKGQKRKGTDIEYIVHPLDVASILLKNNEPEDLVVAGLLHDVVEDTKVGLAEIKKQFGTRVANLVKGATEPKKLKKGIKLDEKKTWEQRKRHTISFIKNASRDMKILSCADKLSNIQSMIYEHAKVGERLWEKFNAPKEKQEWYYRSMLDAFVSGKISITESSMFLDFKKCVEQLFGRRR